MRAATLLDLRGGKMRRPFVVVVVVMAAALTVTATAWAATTVQKIPFNAEVVICNGDTVDLSGTLLDTVTTTPTPSGGTIFAFHDNPQGIRGVDTTTGTVFHATGLTREVDVTSPPGGFTSTFVNRFHIQATGGAQSFIVSETEHITITPSGRVTVSFDNFSSTC
jgi:hypothetical protein